MKIKEKKRKPDPIIKEIFQPVAVPSIGSAVARLRAEFSLSESMLPEMDSIEAICEHLERLLSDERLLKREHNHTVIQKFYDKLTAQYIGELEKALDTASSAGGKAAAIPFKEQKRVIQDYYRNHRKSYKSKDIAASDIERKEEIGGVKITVKYKKIREYLINI